MTGTTLRPGEPAYVEILILESPADGPDGFDVFDVSLAGWEHGYGLLDWRGWVYVITTRLPPDYLAGRTQGGAS